MNKFIHIKLVLIGVLFCFIFSFRSHSQAIWMNPVASSYIQPSIGIHLGTLFNHQDFLLDFGIGYDGLGYDWSISFNGTFRPYYKTVQFKVDDHLYYQTKEKIIQFSIDIEKRFYFLQFINYNKFGIYGAAKFGYFYGKYKGLFGARNNQFVITPGGGLTFQFKKNARLNLGYFYFKQNPFSSPHTIQLKGVIYINLSDDKTEQ